ncbi:ADP-heptose:LPS heptosyltransferase [Pedobacter sp. UYP30]|uniref:glycosyltransferase family 9 protein n=1 Tax=Pedobacter sp. UYP30 TaxID=1756400 RepID=UPI003399BD21
MKEPSKILVIRFSSIGDIIYTTPVVRCLKNRFPDAEIHFLTKSAFKYIYQNNPYLTKLHLLEPKLRDTIKAIKAEDFDLIVDLHNNLRTSIIKFALQIPALTYKKERIKKWLALKFKWTKLIPNKHLVDRYLEAVKPIGVVNDGKPVDYFFAESYQLDQYLPLSHQSGFVAFIIGATHNTKRLPNHKIIEICKGILQPIVLIGGSDVKVNGDLIKDAIGEKIVNLCGTINLDKSIFILSKSLKVIGFDTGLTHISGAFNKPLVSIWGGTTPELLGVQPYHISNSYMVGVDLPCRPCSKFGLEKCPLGHFKCMENIPSDLVVNYINS